MANIQPDINKIKEAIYGEEVRSSIVNALTKMNTQAAAAQIWATGADVDPDDPSYVPPSSENSAKGYAEAAEDAQEAAEDAQTAAEAAQGAAETAETNAGNSATAAASSETNAAASASSASGSATAAAASAAQAQNGEAWAVGQRGGVDVPSTDPAYNNHAKFWSQQAMETAQTVTAEAIGDWLDAHPTALSDAVVLEKLSTYSTMADLTADTSIMTGQVVLTRGYTTDGDGGACMYYISDTEMQGEYNIALTGGKYAVMIPPDAVTPEMFGATCDNTIVSGSTTRKTTDTAAIEYALNHYSVINLTKGKTYYFHNRSGIEIVVNHDITINGNGATIKRPNLLEEPYNLDPQWIPDPTPTDPDHQKRNPDFEEIRTDRFIRFYGPTSNYLIQINDVKFDCNAMASEMWQPSDGYKYEQAPCIMVAGALQNGKERLYNTNVVINRCAFYDSFSSGVSMTSFATVTFHECVCRNCFKGMVTLVGDGCLLTVSDCQIYNDYPFHTINIEINERAIPGTSPTEYYPWPERERTDVVINNTYLERMLKIGSMTGGGKVEISNMIAQNICWFNVASLSSVSITNSSIEFSTENGVQTAEAEPIKVLARTSSVYAYVKRYINYTNVDFIGLDLYPELKVALDPSATCVLTFTGCKFKHLNRCVSVTGQTANSNVIIFSKCVFEDVVEQTVETTTRKGYIIGPLESASNMSLSKLVFDSCIIDIHENSYIAYLNAPTRAASPTVIFSGNSILSANKGIYDFGRDYNLYVFKDEVWDYGYGIAKYYGNNYSPRAIGTRYRHINSAPTGDAFNNVDIAISTVDNVVTKYEYRDNGWQRVDYNDEYQLPRNPKSGDLFYNTTEGKQFVWDGLEWVAVQCGIGRTTQRPSSNLYSGYLYLDTTLKRLICWNGEAWVDAGKIMAGDPALTYSCESFVLNTTAITKNVSNYTWPIGMLCFHVLSRQLYIWSGMDWLPLVRISGPTSDRPKTTITGMLYYDTTEGKQLVYAGSTWVDTGADSGATGNRPTGIDAGYLYFDTTVNRLQFWDGSAWANAFIATSGATNKRPSGTSYNPLYVGTLYYDTSLSKLIVWNGTAWVNVDGSALS